MYTTLHNHNNLHYRVQQELRKHDNMVAMTPVIEHWLASDASKSFKENLKQNK